MDLTKEERRILAEVAAEFLRDGYEAVPDPPADDLPEVLRRYRPDLIARRGDDGVVIGVVTRGDEVAARRAREIAEATEGADGWRFELVVAPAPRTPPRMMTGDEARRRLRVAETAAAGDASAGCLLVWTAAEWALRKLIGRDAEPSLPAKRLVKEALSAGELGKADHALLDRLAGLRNGIVHGARGERIDRRTVKRAVRVVGPLVDRAAAATALS